MPTPIRFRRRKAQKIPTWKKFNRRRGPPSDRPSGAARVGSVRSLSRARLAEIARDRARSTRVLAFEERHKGSSPRSRADRMAARRLPHRARVEAIDDLIGRSLVAQLVYTAHHDRSAPSFSATSGRITSRARTCCLFAQAHQIDDKVLNRHAGPAHRPLPAVDRGRRKEKPYQLEESHRAALPMRIRDRTRCWNGCSTTHREPALRVGTKTLPSSRTLNLLQDRTTKPQAAAGAADDLRAKSATFT